MHFRLALASALILSGVAAPAQTPPQPARYSSAGDPADRLAGYLRTLAASPRDVEALSGAGRAALDVGDANAAIGFYARAEGVAPRDGRIKAGLGAALLRMGKAKDALRLFGQAVDFGVPETDIASDRGLAWDLRGEPRKAQRDYQLAMRAGADDETTRRLALSLAISGDQAGATQLLTPLLYRHDSAAWRARAFVLALTGDTEGAVTIAGSAMPVAQAQAMRPFLSRLAALRPDEKARAVHFGEMPSDGTRYSPTEMASVGGGRVERSYRPEDRREIAASAAAVPLTTLPATPSRSWLRNRQQLLRAYSPKAAAAELKADQPSTPAPVPGAERGAAPVRLIERQAATGRRTILDDAADTPLLAFKLEPPERPGSRKARTKAEPVAEELAVKEKEKPKARLDRKAETKALAAKKKEAEEKRAAKVSPERIWVQVAGGANKDDLGKAWTAAKSKSSDLKRRAASTTKVRATNRLMVGPFKSREEAQALVNKLPGAFIVTTDRGQAVEKLAGK